MIRIGLIYLLFLSLLFMGTGCCNRYKKVSHKKKGRKKSYLSNLYNDRQFSMEEMLDKNNIFTNWAYWKAEFEYFYKKHKRIPDPAEMKVRRNQDFRKSIQLFERGNYQKSYLLAKRTYQKMYNNRYARHIFKKIEAAYLYNTAFKNENVGKVTYYLANGKYNQAEFELEKIRGEARKNPYLLKEYYKLGVILYNLKRENREADEYLLKYNTISKKLRKKYGL